MARYQGTEVDPLNPPEGAVSATPAINLLLIGQSGVGKSATGNSILQLRKGYLRTDDMDAAVKKTCQVEYARYKEQVVKIVDMPGLVSEGGYQKELRQSFAEADAIAPEGFDAVLFVVRFGRQSRDTRDTFQRYREVLGHDVFTRNGILVVTHGNDFKREIGNTRTFKEYCSDLSGQINELWKECNMRAVLFENVKAETSQIETQRRELFVTVLGLKKRRIERYTCTYINDGKKEGRMAFEERKMEIRLLIHDLNDVEPDATENKDDIEKCQVQLKRIKETALQFAQQITIEMKDNIALRNLMNLTEVFEETATLKLSLLTEKCVNSSHWVHDKVVVTKEMERQKRCLAEKESQLEDLYQNLKFQRDSFIKAIASISTRYRAKATALLIGTLKKPMTPILVFIFIVFMGLYYDHKKKIML